MPYKDPKDQQLANARWSQKNKAKRVRYSLAYQKRYPEKHADYMKEYNARPETRERHRTEAKQFYHDNREEILAQRRAVRGKLRPLGGRSEYGWAKNLMSNCKATSEKRGHAAPGISFMDIVAAWDRQGGRCSWTGIQMTKEYNCPRKVSVDRIDNNSGYTPENIQLCAWFVNRARHRMTADEFSEILLEMASTLPAATGF